MFPRGSKVNYKALLRRRNSRGKKIGTLIATKSEPLALSGVTRAGIAGRGGPPALLVQCDSLNEFDNLQLPYSYDVN